MADRWKDNQDNIFEQFFLKYFEFRKNSNNKQNDALNEILEYIKQKEKSRYWDLYCFLQSTPVRKESPYVRKFSTKPLNKRWLIYKWKSFFY